MAGKLSEKGLFVQTGNRCSDFLARKEQIAKPNMAGKFEEPVFFLE